MSVDPAAAQRQLTQTFIELYPAEAAHQLEDVPAADIVRLLEMEPTGRAARLWEKLSPQLAADVLDAMDEPAVADLLKAADVTRAAGVLARVGDATRDRFLELLPPGQHRELRDLLTYPEGTAGQMMDPRVVSFPPEMIVRDVIDKVHTLRQQRVQTVFVADVEGRLTGALSLQDVILADSTTRIEELITAGPRSVQATAPRDEIVEVLTDYRLGSLPVIDFEGRLIGTIRREALIQAVQEQATAGIQTMVGVSRDERALSPPLFVVRKRLGWLNINLLTAFLAAAVVGVFEGTIARFTALAVLLPVVAGQSGNTGAQALAVTMRGLALREIRLRHWAKVTIKEGTAGAINGIAIAIVTMIGVYFWDGRLGLCLIIGVSMVFSMAIAAIAGTVIPMVLTFLRQDPAQSSSIILTTVTDVIGFLTFLGLATLLAGLLE